MSGQKSCHQRWRLGAFKRYIKAGAFFGEIKKAIDLPLTIKIRTGWDSDSINAPEVIRIAKEEGVEFVAIHGEQEFSSIKAKLGSTESFAMLSPLPIIGNGDLHTSYLTTAIKSNTLSGTHAWTVTLLRDPFIFLTSFLNDDERVTFSGRDYLEVINRLYQYQIEYAAK